MPQIQLTITFDTDTGSINVTGPIENKMLSYGLLESARDAILDFNVKKTADQRIVPAHFSLLPRGPQ